VPDRDPSPRARALLLSDSHRQVRQAPTKGDLDALSKRIDSLETAAAKNSKETQNAINTSVTQLQQTLASLQKQQAQNSANIATLQTQASAGAFSKGCGGPATGTAGHAPGTTTTTTTGK